MMKKNFFKALVAMCIVCCAFQSCGYSTPSSATPQYFTEQEQVTSRCGQCNGSGVLYGYYGPTQCFVCHGQGVTISFKSKQAYYAECAHHNGCKLFVRERTGSTTCKCGCSMFSHVKRYR